MDFSFVTEVWAAENLMAPLCVGIGLHIITKLTENRKKNRSDC